MKSILSARKVFVVVLALAALVMLGLSACGGGGDSASTTTAAPATLAPTTSTTSAASAPAPPASPGTSALPSPSSPTVPSVVEPISPPTTVAIGPTAGPNLDGPGDANQAPPQPGAPPALPSLEGLLGQLGIEDLTPDIRVVVENGEITQGQHRYEVDLGQELIIEVYSDVDDQEVHLHGYDLHAHTGLTSPARFEFVADLPGVWEAEFEATGQHIFELAVS